MSKRSPLIDVKDLSVDYGKTRQATRVVHSVSLDVRSAETVGLVGESGSGKSTIGKAILGLVPVAAGSIHFDGEDITHCSSRRRRELTREIQVIYQDPYGSLNPARTVGSTLAEPLTVRGKEYTSREVKNRVLKALDMVGLPANVAERYPGDFSGGQRQRIAIARAVIVRPRFIVCDEAVSALDLSIQAQVLNLLADFSQELGVSYLFISHDLTVVSHVAARTAVLFHGRLVEFGDSKQVSSNPTHPYTTMLQAAAPVPDPLMQRDRREEFARRSAQFKAGGGQ
jgi:ABC-type oligopeptide transport system ATPase subunit